MPGIAPEALTLSVLDERFAVCRLAPEARVPEWAMSGTFSSVTRTLDELSIVCPEEHVPSGVLSEGGWRALKLIGPFDFSLTGVLASVLAPLAEDDIPIFAVSTYDTDYALVGEGRLDEAVSALKKAGHEVRR